MAQLIKLRCSLVGRAAYSLYCLFRDALVENCTALTNNYNAGVLEWALFTFCPQLAFCPGCLPPL